jgi:hypothetical protein
MATNIPIIPNISGPSLRGNLKEAEEKAWNWTIPHNKPNYSSPAPSPAPSLTPSPPSSVVSKPAFVVRKTYSPPEKKKRSRRSRRTRRTRKVRR